MLQVVGAILQSPTLAGVAQLGLLGTGQDSDGARNWAARGLE